MSGDGCAQERVRTDLKEVDYPHTWVGKPIIGAKDCEYCGLLPIDPTPCPETFLDTLDARILASSYRLTSDFTLDDLDLPSDEVLEGVRNHDYPTTCAFWEWVSEIWHDERGLAAWDVLLDTLEAMTDDVETVRTWLDNYDPDWEVERIVYIERCEIDHPGDRLLNLLGIISAW